MSSAQKVVKYLAFGFAGFLAFAIISGIVAAGAGVLTAVGVIGSKGEETISCDGYEKCLSLGLNYSELYIKTGDELKVETAADDYEISQEKNKLVVKDKKKVSWFGNNSGRKVTVTVPSDMVFDAVGIGNGAGKIEVESLATKELTMSVGAGETIIKDITVTEKAKIDTGAGKFVIENGSKINNAKISLGVGETNIRAAIMGDSKVDAGVGSVNLDLLLPDADYEIKVDKGIGEIKFNGASVSSGSVLGSGENKIDIDGGIGEINVKTAEPVMHIVEKTDEKADADTKADTEVKTE